MTEHEPITIEEMFALSRKEFIARHKAWLKELDDDYEYFDIVDPLECPLHLWVMHNRAKCKRDTIPNTATCPLCGYPCCPDCMNHNVEQLSRVTGYLSGVSSWGAAKKQEFKDRQRFNIG